MTTGDRLKVLCRTYWSVRNDARRHERRCQSDDWMRGFHQGQGDAFCTALRFTQRLLRPESKEADA